jgi:hypothetical protein
MKTYEEIYYFLLNNLTLHNYTRIEIQCWESAIKNNDNFELALYRDGLAEEDFENISLILKFCYHPNDDKESLGRALRLITEMILCKYPGLEHGMCRYYGRYEVIYDRDLLEYYVNPYLNDLEEAVL